jgi:DNA-binding LytR/AlgR family response regulator
MSKRVPAREEDALRQRELTETDDDRFFDFRDEDIVDEKIADEVAPGHEFVYLANAVRGWILRSREIRYLEAEANYTRVMFGKDARVLIRQSLGKLEKKLDPRIFFRVGRSCIVNLGYVRATRMFDQKRLLFELADGKHFVLSRQRSVFLKKSISL